MSDQIIDKTVDQNLHPKPKRIYIRDVIDKTADQILCPTPKETYVRNGRCLYCGSKKIKKKWGYEWCDETCYPGRLGLKLYEITNNLGEYTIEQYYFGQNAEKKSD